MAPCMGPMSPVRACSVWAGLCPEKLVKQIIVFLNNLNQSCEEVPDFTVMKKIKRRDRAAKKYYAMPSVEMNFLYFFSTPEQRT